MTELYFSCAIFSVIMKNNLNCSQAQHYIIPVTWTVTLTQVWTWCFTWKLDNVQA